MQYGHWVTCATATAISCFVTSGNAPLVKTARLNVLKASSMSGASSWRRCPISVVAIGKTDSVMMFFFLSSLCDRCFLDVPGSYRHRRQTIVIPGPPLERLSDGESRLMPVQTLDAIQP